MHKPIVKIVWHDAQDHPDKWTAAEDAESFANEACEIVSIGWLVSETAKYVTLAGDWDNADADYGRVTKIPKGCVVSQETL